MQVGVPVLEQPIATAARAPIQKGAVVRPGCATVVATEYRHHSIQKCIPSDVETNTIQFNKRASI
jgi:hypothetical protein